MVGVEACSGAGTVIACVFRMHASDSNSAGRAAEDPASREHIDVDDKAAVDRWAQALGTTDEALLNAVRQVGTRIDRIKEYLGQGGIGAQQSGG